MQKWLSISLLLCVYGFFRELRPSEPFVTEYLSSDRFNLTIEQVNKEIYPFGTYAVLTQLVIVFLITDILRYKPIIVLSACAGIILYSLLLWTRTVWELQICQVFFGMFMATEVAYYTYIYAKVERDRFQIVSGHTRSAALCGKFLAGLLAQVLISTQTMNYRGLHFISFGAQVVSLFIALLLPSVRKSIYFYIDAKGEISGSSTTAKPKMEVSVETTDCRHSNAYVSDATLTPTELTFSWNHALNLLLQQTVSAFSNATVVKWSIWMVLATCGQLQVITYCQFLWKDIDPNHENFYNGAVEATVTLLGAAGAMCAGLMDSNRSRKWNTWIVIICTLLMGAFMIISAITNLVTVAYAMYILFGMIFYFVLTIATANIAQNLSDDSFGLIFGINQLVSLILQTILTVVVVTDTGFGLGPRNQFIVYGSFFIVLAFLYSAILFLFKIFAKSKSVKSMACSNANGI